MVFAVQICVLETITMIDYIVNVVRSRQYGIVKYSLKRYIRNAMEFFNGKIVYFFRVSLLKYKHLYGKKFVFNRMYNTIDTAKDDYEIFDLRPTDIVLDIGAGVGAFSLMVCDRVKHVYAVEPLFHEELFYNILLNCVTNATIINNYIGDRNYMELSFGGKRSVVRGTTLSDIIQDIGKVDFIKCDCEGCEWSLTADDLLKVRRIEMEYHIMKDNGKTLHDLLSVIEDAGFEYRVQRLGVASASSPNMLETGLIHAWRTQ